MSVEFEPINENVFGLGVTNKTWFTLANTSDIAKLIGEQRFNDPLIVGESISKKCSEAVKAWNPPAGWWRSGNEDEGKKMFMEFFENCGGFKTY